MDWPVRFDEQTAKGIIGIYLLQNPSVSHDRIAAALKRDESSDEGWLIRSFLRCDSSASDIAMQLTVNCSVSGKLHIIISIDDKRMLDELQSSFDKQKSTFTADILSVTYLLFDKSSRSVTYEYTDGDLGLKKRSEQRSGTSTVPSATPR